MAEISIPCLLKRRVSPRLVESRCGLALGKWRREDQGFQDSQSEPEDDLNYLRPCHRGKKEKKKAKTKQLKSVCNDQEKWAWNKGGRLAAEA